MTAAATGTGASPRVHPQRQYVLMAVLPPTVAGPPSPLPPLPPLVAVIPPTPTPWPHPAPFTGPSGAPRRGPDDRTADRPGPGSSGPGSGRKAIAPVSTTATAPATAADDAPDLPLRHRWSRP